jgi:hypothetical protein
LQENIHHRDTEYTEILKFFVCREIPANENRQPCLRQEQGALFLSEGILFFPSSAPDGQKIAILRDLRACGEHMFIKDKLSQSMERRPPDRTHEKGNQKRVYSAIMARIMSEAF